MIVIPYVEKVSEAIGRIMKKHNVPVAMKPWKTIDWKKTTVINREQDRPTRWIKEAVHICKEGHRAMNRDEGSYQLSHAYDRFLDATANCRIKTRKN